VSTLLYARFTDQRVRAPKRRPPAPRTLRIIGLAREEETVEAPPEEKPTKRYLDAFAALVPAEALALHALVINLTTSTEEGADGQAITTITDPGLLRGSFWALLLTSVALFVGPRLKNWTGLDGLRLFIPPMAFIGWMLLTQPSAIQDVIFFRDWSEPMKAIVAAFGVTFVGLLAAGLAYKADVSDPHNKNPE
jgi:hypothetical protein